MIEWCDGHGVNIWGGVTVDRIISMIVLSEV